MDPGQILSSQSTLYALGSNGSGQLGIGDLEDVDLPRRVLHSRSLPKATILDIASGGNHTVVLFDDGTIATTGENDDGRCLTTTRELTYTLESQALASRVSHVAATWSATITVCTSNQVYVSGTGTFGELGLGPDKKLSKEWALLQDFPPAGTEIVKVSSCMAHVVAVLSNGEVWGWGGGRKGQLGEPAEIVWKPRKIQQCDFSAVDAVCGKDFTCIFGHPSTGRFTILGLNRNDRFDVRKHAPKDLMRWKQVAASWGSIFVLVESGELVSWGRNDHGQLPSSSLPPLQSIATGSEHCVGLTKEGKPFSWGWGEHGNCGNPIDSNGDVSGRQNIIETSNPATKVFAGCATSFIVTNEAFGEDEPDLKERS